MKAKVNKVTIQLVRDDVWSVSAVAKVNATDTNLTLHPRLAALAGVDVQREIAVIGHTPVGSAVITNAGQLPADKVIHAVGPRWGEGSERGKLLAATFDCLHLAETNGLKSIAIPALSTGALGYPVESCANTMLSQIIDYTFEDLRHLRQVILCLDTSLVYDIFKREFEAQILALNAEA